MNSRRIIYFFPQNPCPPKSGAHVRCLEMLKAVTALGYDTTLASSDYTSKTAWTQSSIRTLERDFVSRVRVHRPSLVDRYFVYSLTRLYKSRRRAYPITSVIHTPPGMRIWFARLFNNVLPKAVFMSYAYWDGLVRHGAWSKTCRVVDTLDFMSLNAAMRKALESYLPPGPVRPSDVDDRALQEGFYDELGLRPDPDEMRTFARYTWSIAISDMEEDLLRQYPNRSQVVLIPATHEPQYVTNTYDGPAVFPTGPNPFNIQGYCYFVKKVLPGVLQRVESFCLQVTGYVCDHVATEVGIRLSGFIPELQAVYSSARFMICPVFGGTGQQIKIVEAMANGLAIIALEGAARGSPLQHGVNGFVAQDAEEFAEYTIRLWKDKALCRQLGSAAREVIAADFSQERLRGGLSSIIEPDRDVSPG